MSRTSAAPCSALQSIPVNPSANWRGAIRRSRAFYSATEGGHFLVVAHVPAAGPTLPPLYEFDLERELERWLDCRLEAMRPLWAAKQGLDDDSVPCIAPYFGIAEHTAWLGMEVQLQQETCLPRPMLRSLDEIGKLRLRDDTPWFGYMKHGYEHLRHRQDGEFVLGVRGTMTPMDMANAVRGDELFYEFVTEQKKVHRLVNWLTDAVSWYFDQLRSWADEIDGGHVYTQTCGWVGPNGIGHLSNDSAVLCSPEVYAEFGYPYEQRLFSRYGAVVYHIHNEKMHFVPKLATLPNLGIIEVTNDPRTPPAAEDLPRVLAATGSARLMLHMNSDELRAHIDELNGRNVLFEAFCRNRKDAEDVVKLVRARSKPL